MKYYVFSLVILFIFLSCDFCKPLIDYERKPHCEYNPEKAGADIIRKYYIMDLFQFFHSYLITFDECKGKLYFSAYSNYDDDLDIYIFDKTTMEFERKVHIPLSLNYFSVSNFTIHNNKILFLASNKESKKIFFFSIDLSDNILKEIDTIETFGLNINEIGYFGVDKATDQLYLEKKEKTLQFFTYNKDSKTYNASKSVSIAGYNSYNFWLYGNTVYRYFSTIEINGDCPAYIYIHNLSDVSVIEKTIDLNYLNSVAVFDILYDGEFIWAITEDENYNALLLKLKLL